MTSKTMPPSLDPQAVNLAKAIRQQESGGNFTAKGKSGEYGAYQYTPETWASDSQKYGVNVSLDQATPEQQNEVAYKKIKELKDQGYNVGQIASIWNSGKPDAYLDPNYKGVNKFGAQYDVPGYAKAVAENYQHFKSSGQQPDQLDIPQKKDFLQSVGDIINTIFPGKQIGEAIGTEIAKAGADEQGKQFINKYEPGPTPLQVAGDVGQAGLMVAAPGVGTGGSVLGRIGSLAALGAASGATGALAEGKDNIQDIGSSAGAGALTGGLLGGAGELAGAATKYLPYRIARSFLPGTNPETVNYAIKKGLGTPGSMLKRSDASLTKVGSAIEQVLNKPEVETVLPITRAEDILPQVLEQYPNAGLTPQLLADELKKLVPLQKGLVDKLFTEGLNAQELNNLKTAIGGATYKTVFDEPAVKAGKTLGNSLYHSISDYFKQKLPETTPLFEEYTKELQLNGALSKAVRSMEKGKVLTLRDILAFFGGNVLGGGVGGLGALALEKAATSPSVNLTTAGLLSKIPTSQLGGLGRLLTVPAASKAGSGQ